MRSILAVSVAATILYAAFGVSPALADVKAGVDAWARGDYAAAVKEWQAPADKGDADAQFNLGQAYKLGRGVKQDLPKAEALFAQAAGKGHLQAADNYGLLLFHRGAREQALPYLRASSDRGDSRAQYLIGIAHFNGDLMPKDWVRAYALVSLAHQAGLPQAAAALAQMDAHIPLEQRQASIAVATELAERASAMRSQQNATADLASTTPGAPAPMSTPAATPIEETPQTAGADFVRPKAAVPEPKPVAIARHSVPEPKAVSAPKPVTAPKPAVVPAKSTATPSPWRIQLGAFGVAANAEALWNRVKNRPEVAGHSRQLVPSGKVTRLLVTGFGSQTEAQGACNRMTAGGFSCLVTRD